MQKNNLASSSSFPTDRFKGLCLGGGGRGITSYNILYGIVLMCVPNAPPPFSALPSIWLAPFFQQKVYDRFSRFVCERPHFSDIPVYTYIFAHRFFEAACSLGIQ